MGKVLHVDLRSEEFETKKLDLDVARDYVGGLGLNAWLMEQVYVTGTDPLSPDNPIILGAGPLVGTNTPGAAKIVATTRFPLNGTISESVGSMRFALNVKGAGFDHLIITGRSKKPVVLVLEDDKASFMDAKELWGLDIFETTDALKKSYAGRRSSVIAIGPAGENRVTFSLALVDKASTVGRGGLGAVMGSKNLKAIVAMGDQRPRTILAFWNWASWRTGTIMFSNSLAAGILRAHFRLKRRQNFMGRMCIGVSKSRDSAVPHALPRTRIISR
jgi:aldehyde:ferredoxin oxidoreductase